MHWSAKYLGIPYVRNGYSAAGAYCWGLVWLVQREVFGRDLPKWPHGDPAEFQGGISRLAPKPIALEDAREGDVLSMKSVGERHIGVFAGDDRVLHTEEATGSLIERIASKRLSWRIVQAYRLA